MDDDEAMLTGEVPELPEFPEFTEALIGPVGPRFVQLHDRLWVNPAYVRAVEGEVAADERPIRECWVHLGGRDEFLVGRPAAEVVALLTADTPEVDPNQLEIPGVR
jgi:hypothetical protein